MVLTGSPVGRAGRQSGVQRQIQNPDGGPHARSRRAVSECDREGGRRLAAHVVTVAPRGEAEGDVEGRREETTLEAVDARGEAPGRAQRGRRRRGRTRRSAAERGTPRGRPDAIRQEALEGLRAQSEKKPRGGSADDKRVKQLEKELRRKEKALAEAAAILVLRKKVQALWGEEGEDTTEDSDK